MYRKPMIVILCDCQEAVSMARSLRQYGTYWSASETLVKLTQKLRSKHYRVVIDWIPGHTGFAGNERADTLASEAARDSRAMSQRVRIGKDLQLPFALISTRINMAARDLNKRRYTETTSRAAKLKEFTEMPGSTSSYPVNISGVLRAMELPRQAEICFERLCTGCAVTNVDASYITDSGVTDTMCDACNNGVKDSAEHRLLLCPAYAIPREKLRKEILGQSGVLEMRHLVGMNRLDPKGQTERITRVVAFLRETKLINLFYFKPGTPI